MKIEHSRKPQLDPSTRFYCRPIHLSSRRGMSSTTHVLRAVTRYQCSTKNPFFAMSLTIAWRHVAAGSLPETEFFQIRKVFLQT